MKYLLCGSMRNINYFVTSHTYTFADDIKKLFHTGTKTEYKRRSIILKPGEIPSEISYIEKGFVEVYGANTLPGNSLHIIYTKAEIFPVSWIVNKIRRNVMYRAMSDCTIYSLPRGIILSMVENNSQLSFHLLQQVTEQFTLYSDRIDNLEYRYASDRLAYYLIFLASRFGEHQGAHIVLQAPLTHQIIGDSINLSRESVSRELDKLVQKNIITFKGRTIIIKDTTALRKTFKQPTSPNWWGLVNPQEIGPKSQFIG